MSTNFLPPVSLSQFTIVELKLIVQVLTVLGHVVCRERYRDLIEAADTISSIKSGAEDVYKSVERIERMTKAISTDKFTLPDGSKLRSDSIYDEKLVFLALSSLVFLLQKANFFPF